MIKMYPIVSKHGNAASDPAFSGNNRSEQYCKNMETNIKNEDKLISRRQLGERWACSRETLKRRERAGILPVYKLGKGVRYKLHDVEAIEKAALVNKG